jgi:hypothetical protein
MRRLCAGVALALTVSWLAEPAAALMVEVTTSISMDDIRDDAQLRDALQRTVDSVLSDAIAFQPTMVLLTHVVVKGGRLYVRLLVADQEGERAFRDLEPEREPERMEITL